MNKLALGTAQFGMSYGVANQHGKIKLEDIKEYENGYDRENLSVVLKKLKKIREKNVILSKKYTYGHIKSIDIVFLF